MSKLEQAAREVIRQHSMECLSDKTVDALREALAEQVHTPYCKQAPMCKTPCGNSDCVEQAEQEPVRNNDWKRVSYIRETLNAEQAEQEPFDMDDHPPHRLCECRKCMEYFTPLPDCDAFAASGKLIAEQTNTQLMEGYRIGLAEMREKCATVSEQGTGEAVQKTALELLINERKRIAAAIRAIKFEGDTGFRPVSEMIAEHKQDPKKAAAIEKAKMRKAEQKPVTISCECGDIYERDSFGGRFIKLHGICPNCDAVPQAEQKPVAVVEITYGREPECYVTGNIDDFPEGVFKLYAAPVRTKDLTDDEIEAIMVEQGDLRTTAFARAVIAADRELNR